MTDDTPNTIPATAPVTAPDAIDDSPNEILAAAQEKAAQKRRMNKALPVAVGIGSAALTAALLYANRRRKD